MFGWLKNLRRGVLCFQRVDPAMRWATEYGCTFAGCESTDVWMIATPTKKAIAHGHNPDEVAVLCRTHTQLMADENHGGKNYPAHLIEWVKVGSTRNHDERSGQ